jgi:hypothetical protein
LRAWNFCPRRAIIGFSLGCIGILSHAQPAQALPGKSPISSPTGSLPMPNAPRSVASVPAIPPSSPGKVKFDEERPKNQPIDWYTRAAAFIGLCLGVFNLVFGMWKIRRDRRISIEDDFWFRKIITPATIEPLLKAFVGLVEVLPVRNTAAEDQKTYALKVTTEFAKLYPAVQTLALFEEKLPALVTAKLVECEDVLTDYSALLTQPDASKDMLPAQLRVALWAKLNATLRVIKDHHLKS